MDMLKINIGNDIRIDFKIKTPEELGNADMAIKSLRCFLINTSDNNHLSHRIKRFPNEPFPQYYDPTEYTLRDCGSPKYNAIPVNGTIIDYKGFGIKSKKFNNHIYQAFSQEGEDGVYLAFFPKIHLKSFGKYKFVVAVSYYEKGWGKCDIHDITIDFGEIFEIVKEGGNTGYIVIKLYGALEENPEEVYTYSLSASNVSFSLDGGSKSVTIFLNSFVNGDLSNKVPYSNFIYSTDNDYFNVVRIDDDPSSIKITADKNESVSSKISIITITPGENEYDLDPIEIKISQNAKEECYLGECKNPELAPNSFDLENNFTKYNTSTLQEVSYKCKEEDTYICFVSTKKCYLAKYEIGSNDLVYLGEYDNLHYHYIPKKQGNKFAVTFKSIN